MVQGYLWWDTLVCMVLFCTSVFDHQLSEGLSQWERLPQPAWSQFDPEPSDMSFRLSLAVPLTGNATFNKEPMQLLFNQAKARCQVIRYTCLQICNLQGTWCACTDSGIINLWKILDLKVNSRLYENRYRTFVDLDNFLN